EAVVSTTRVGESLVLAPKTKLEAGANSYWLSVVLKDDANIDGRVAVALNRVKAGDKVLTPENPSPGEPQRVGVGLRLHGDDGSKFYRIPGMVRTKAGTLIAVYDIRYRHSGDLPADVDVGAQRSTDGGQTWEKMRVAMDMGSDPAHGYDGVGDP